MSMTDSIMSEPLWSNSKTPFVAPEFLTIIVSSESQSSSTSIIELSSWDEAITV